MGKDISMKILRTVKLKNEKELILRIPTVEDAEAIVRYCNIVGGESDNLLFGKDEFPLTVEEEKAFLEKIDENANMLLVLGIIDDEIVSVANINSPNRKRIAHNSEIGISVKKAYWGKGIGSLMMEELIRFAKEHPLINNISLGVKASNQDAIKLYKKFGFEEIGLYHKYFNVEGSFDDKVIMNLYL
ncbi:GNAT family N-acetyltransferase [Alkaliphilus transvaalensis]|uniref:GNAT family N-acetyltransferase n=1 Tax=Alkaliphilus transvaalensis TaxID=114628 RepID=UPI0004789ABD|nr:GNAT family protein [Alkaliphilus transvaalensis]